MKFPIIVCSLLLLTCSSATAQDWAKERLNQSPRHLEWVNIKRGDRELKCFIAYPEVKDKATSVLVIHEIFGMTDWVRGVCDQLAAKGYIAIAPDLLSGKAFDDVDSARKAIATLNPDQVTEDLKATADYVEHQPAANGKLAVAGFCWGGTQTFRFATNQPDIKAALVFYGTAPENTADLARITAPVYGFYAENDARVGATIEKTTAQVKAAGKEYEPKTYAGAGHGFMRAGEAPDADAANKAAHDQSWERLLKILNKLK
jgi:carboxymethylenebutenolidase